MCLRSNTRSLPADVYAPFSCRATNMTWSVHRGCPATSRKIYPETASSSSSGSGGSNIVTYKYNTQRQAIESTDQNDTAHAYSYDRLGRLLSDIATINDSAIDDRVDGLENVRDVRGLLRSGPKTGTINTSSRPPRPDSQT